MKQPRASWLTVHKGDIDPYDSLEILWHTDSNTLHLLMFRVSRGAGRPQLTTQQTGPYRHLAELRQQIGVLFGQIVARRICRNPNSWLPQQLKMLARAPHNCQDAHDFDKQRDYRSDPLAVVAPLAAVTATGTGVLEARPKKFQQELLPTFGGQTAPV